MKLLQTLFSIIVLAIGLYMIVQFWNGQVSPPVLSGVAFVCIAVRQLIK